MIQIATPEPITAGEIRYFRGFVGLTQGDLAQALGVSRRGVEKWEAGRSRASAFLRLALDRLALSIAAGNAGAAHALRQILPTAEILGVADQLRG